MLKQGMANIFERALAFARDRVERAENRGHPMEHGEAGLLANYKHEMLLNAAALAKSEGREHYTMTDVYRCGLAMGEKYQDTFRDQNIPWSPKIYADLSGQTLENARVEKDAIMPSKDIQRTAVYLATQEARAAGRKPNLANALQKMSQLQEQQRQGQKLPEIPTDDLMKDMLDLDCDHAVSSYYAEVESQTRFHDTIFNNVHFHPAGTLMKYDADGASFTKCTFDGMETDDHVTLKSGTYKDIKLINAQGGIFEIATGAQVDGLSMQGAHVALEIGKASINHLDARDAHIVSLTASPGAEIAHAHFDGATIDMGSQLQGTVWKDVKFTGANLVDVDMSGAILTNVRFADANLTNLDLKNAKLTNVTFTASQLAGLNLEGAQMANVSIDGFPIRSAADLTMAAQFLQVRETLGKVREFAANDQPLGDIQLALTPERLKNLNLGTGGETTGLGEALMEGAGRAITEMAKPAAPAQDTGIALPRKS